MRLVRVELTRFRSRRAIVLLGLASVLLAAVLAVVTAYQTRPLSAADRADAAAQADIDNRGSVMQSDIADCIKDPEAYLGGNASADDCREALTRDISEYYPRKVLDVGAVLDAKSMTRATGFGLALILTGLMVIAGSTFAGADWSSGSITSQLLFESRRVRLWLAKAAAVLLGSGAVALVTLAGFWLTIWLLANARGIDVSTTAATNIGWHVVRAVALAMGAALGGFALTMVFRHTVATLALLFVYSIGGEIAVGLVPVEGVGRLSVGNNVFGWLATSSRYFDPSVDCKPSRSCNSLQTMTHLESGLYLGALLLIAVVVSVAWFRRKDV